jgi:hypothetical protein
MEENNWYVYRHLKPNGEVFYIGIGKTKNFKRAYEVNSRTKYWKNIVNKYNYEVQILTKNLSKEEACELEKLLILWYKRADCCGGTLVNMTDGGDGASGNIPSEETRKKRSEAQLGRLNHMYGKFGKDNPNYGKQKHSDEQKQKWSLERRGTQVGENNPFYGKKHTDEQIEKWKSDERRTHKGESNGMYGKTGELATCYGRVGDLHPMFGKESAFKGKKHSEESRKKQIENSASAKVVLDIETGIYYNSIKEASKYCRLSYGFLQKVFKGEYKNYTSLRVV